MKATLIATLLLVVFSAKCEDKAKNTSKDEKVTKEPLLEERDKKNDFDLMEIMTDCNETFRVEMSYLQSLNASGSFPDETDRTPKCYLRCVLEKSEIASYEGVYDTERTAEIFSMIRGDAPQSDVKEIATGCSDRSETYSFEDFFLVLLLVMWLIYYLVSMWCVVEPAYWTRVEIEKTEVLINRFLCHIKKYDPLYAELKTFRRQLASTPPSYSPLGVCTLSRKLCVTVLGTATTYLVIVLQFHA